MRPDDKVHLIEQVELVHHFVPEYPASSPRIPPPGLDVLGIGPHQVSQRAFVGYFLLAVQQPHLVDGRQIRGKPSVNAQYVSIDDSAEREEVEGLVEIFPAIRVAVLLVDLI